MVACEIGVGENRGEAASELLWSAVDGDDDVGAGGRRALGRRVQSDERRAPVERREAPGRGPEALARPCGEEVGSSGAGVYLRFMDDGMEQARAQGGSKRPSGVRTPLRDGEAAEREARLSEATAAERRAAIRYDTPLNSLRLQAQVEELLAFRGAVLGSRVWKTAQAARRLVGRAW